MRCVEHINHTNVIQVKKGDSGVIFRLLANFQLFDPKSLTRAQTINPQLVMALIAFAKIFFYLVAGQDR